MHTYLTFEQAAARLQTKPETVRYWVWAGKLPAYKPGRRVLIRESDLIVLIEASRVKARGANRSGGAR